MAAPTIPKSFDSDHNQFARQMMLWVQQQFSNAIRKDQSIGSVMLLSPNGSTYSVTVDNDGNLTTTLIQGST